MHIDTIPRAGLAVPPPPPASAFRRAVKDRAVRALCAASRAWFRHVPLTTGKLLLWERFVRPFLAWRTLPIEARAAFGARFAGGMPDVIHTYLYFFGEWEPVITRYMKALLRPGDIVIDVGANVGAHALLAAHLVGPTGRVHAIEASPSIFESLRRNVARNAASNVVLHHVAVADRPGTLSVFLNEDYNRGGTTVMAAEAARMAATREASVPADRLGAIVPLADLTAARLIKIDVEGAEWLVLEGMRDLLPLLSPRTEILLELNRDALLRSGASIDAVLDLFAAHGFAAWRVPNAYEVSFYLRPPAAEPRRHGGEPFALADMVFRREQGRGSAPDPAGA
jgi:FkbM family methyltransferase